MNQLCAHPEVLMSWHHACGGGFLNPPATELDDSRKPKDGWGWMGMDGDGLAIPACGYLFWVGNEKVGSE